MSALERALELDEIYQLAKRDRDPLVSRFAGHNLPAVSSIPGVTRSNLDQLVTAALIEAYRLGASEARAEADAAANTRLTYQVEAALREFDASCSSIRKVIAKARP